MLAPRAGSSPDGQDPNGAWGAQRVEPVSAAPKPRRRRADAPEERGRICRLVTGFDPYFPKSRIDVFTQCLVRKAILDKLSPPRC